MRIAGLVIRAKPEHLDLVSAALTALPGVEIHARQDSDGKLVVTVEDQPGYSTTDTLTQLQLLDHLVCVTLAYEYSDDTADAAATGTGVPLPQQQATQATTARQG